MTPEQMQRLHKAILVAFTPDSLAELVKFRLDRRLADIALGASFSQAVFGLRGRAEQQGRPRDLARASKEERPGNAVVQAVADESLRPVPTKGPACGLFRVPYPPSPHFTGRKKALADLYKAPTRKKR